MRCAGYDEGFQRDIAERFKDWIPPTRKPRKKKNEKEERKVSKKSSASGKKRKRDDTRSDELEREVIVIN